MKGERFYYYSKIILEVEFYINDLLVILCNYKRS